MTNDRLLAECNDKVHRGSAVELLLKASSASTRLHATCSKTANKPVARKNASFFRKVCCMRACSHVAIWDR